MFKAVLLYSAFEQNYNGPVTCPKYSAHIHLTTTFKKFNSSSTEVKTPNENGRQGRVWISLCLHLAPCLRKSNFLLGLFLAVLTYSEGPNRLSRLLVICSGWRGYYAKWIPTPALVLQHCFVTITPNHSSKQKRRLEAWSLVWSPSKHPPSDFWSFQNACKIMMQNILWNTSQYCRRIP